MFSLYVKTRGGSRVITFVQKDDARQELMRLLDDGIISQYDYQMYLRFLVNGNESVIIDGDVWFEISVPAVVEAE